MEPEKIIEEIQRLETLYAESFANNASASQLNHLWLQIQALKKQIQSKLSAHKYSEPA